jgi:hypothetical protein
MSKIHSTLYPEILAVLVKHGFKQENIPNTWTLEIGKLRHILFKTEGKEIYDLHGQNIATLEDIYDTPPLALTALELDVIITTHLRTAKTWTAFQ